MTEAEFLQAALSLPCVHAVESRPCLSGTKVSAIFDVGNGEQRRLDQVTRFPLGATEAEDTLRYIEEYHAHILPMMLRHA